MSSAKEGFVDKTQRRLRNICCFSQHNVVEPCASTESAPQTNTAPRPRASPFASIPVAPDDPILGLNARFAQDSHPQKLNLGVGAYRTEDGKPLVLNVVRKAEQRILENQTLNKEYIPIDGIKDFQNLSARLILGQESASLNEGRVVTIQSLSGTGSVRVAAEFLARFMPKGTKVLVSVPTWGNHFNIFRDAGLETITYRYWDPASNGLDFAGLMQDFQNAPNNSIVLLHACAHNPTGVDPTPEQWEQIARLMKDKNHFPLLDCAYQGFASGDPEQDAFSIRLFDRLGFSMLIAQSFAKNMGLYGERIGAVNAVCNSQQEANAVRSQFKAIVRPMYSSPQLHGARIVCAILSDPELYAEWRQEVKEMADRIKKMRKELFDALISQGCPGEWNHIMQQIGMFSFTGLKPNQVDEMISKHHVYMTRDGRISMAGLSSKTVPYMASAMKDVVTNTTA
eukprot:TRINITY_DN11485_c0_g1_i1.p1 TRINITY_DN11485_c0_g1~~TRINITY_DN11485_c0_g1_i1.p1  ORF type:complete len:454 (+),score=88.67 TRINITY_DN11485_c0_g1_i1:59-1420(+)